MSILTIKQEQEILRMVKQACKEYNITLYLANAKSVRDRKCKCGGYFSSDDKKIAVAMKNERWALILLHEYFHMQQWIENCNVWVLSNRLRIDYLNDYLTNIKVNKEKLSIAINRTMFLEFDCEKRTINYLKKIGIKKNIIQNEIQKANSYILFYLYVKKNQIWDVPTHAKHIKKIWQACPKKFNYKFETSYQRLEHLYDEYL